MPAQSLLQLPFLLLALVAFTSQVDITITATGSPLTGNAIAVDPSAAGPNNNNRNPRTVIIATCPNIPPGECCQAPRRLATLGSSVVFHRLHVTDIAAVWSARVNRTGFTINAVIDGCSGTVSASQPGPGTFAWRAPTDALTGWGGRAAGASYITLPAALPPDPGTTNWLMMEGLLGLVWGGGKWFASSAAENLLAGRKVGRRSIRSAKEGQVYARPPRRGRYPTLVEIDGTRYHSDRRPDGDFMYADEAGTMPKSFRRTGVRLHLALGFPKPVDRGRSTLPSIWVAVVITLLEIRWFLIATPPLSAGPAAEVVDVTNVVARVALVKEVVVLVTRLKTVVSELELSGEGEADEEVVEEGELVDEGDDEEEDDGVK
ncbi:MAG: hypothetical protein Q9182_003710 [Xanthomendoza sp. 2 TL-2023]